ncbi:hypothetical protein [Halpernia frigidisoli]|nr:hypothetical protein [Halpernia frigidisoli]
MKYDIKPNQMRISKSHKIFNKNILAYKINVEKRIVEEIQIKNSFEYIRKEIDFYNYEEILFSDINREILFIGTDEEYFKKRIPFKIYGIENEFYSNGILLRFSSTNDNENLQSVVSPLPLLKKVVNFEIA